MTLQLDLPPGLEKILRDQVAAGQYGSIEDAVIMKLWTADAPPFFEPMTREQLKADLEKAWHERDSATDGPAFMENLVQDIRARGAQRT